MAAGVVLIGMLAVVLIASFAIFAVDDDAKVAAIATAAVGVIGTVVGTFFGVRLGLEHTEETRKETMKELRNEAAKAQAFAMHMQGADADAVIADAQRLATIEPRPEEPEVPDSSNDS